MRAVCWVEEGAQPTPWRRIYPERDRNLKGTRYNVLKHHKVVTCYKGSPLSCSPVYVCGEVGIMEQE